VPNAPAPSRAPILNRPICTGIGTDEGRGAAGSEPGEGLPTPSPEAVKEKACRQRLQRALCPMNWLSTLSAAERDGHRTWTAGMEVPSA
jgi:hypothetical protein